jgi:hypothetical protein
MVLKGLKKHASYRAERSLRPVQKLEELAEGLAEWIRWRGVFVCLFVCLELQCDKVSGTYGDRGLHQTWRYISDSLLAYSLKMTPANKPCATL